MSNMDISQAIDLRLLRGKNDVVAGVSFQPAIYQVTLDFNGEQKTIQMPVLDVTFMMANNRTRHRISISPDMVMAFIANISGWVMAVEGQLQQQEASPPAPPSGPPAPPSGPPAPPSGLVL